MDSKKKKKRYGMRPSKVLSPVCAIYFIMELSLATDVDLTRNGVLIIGAGLQTHEGIGLTN